MTQIESDLELAAKIIKERGKPGRPRKWKHDQPDQLTPLQEEMLARISRTRGLADMEREQPCRCPWRGRALGARRPAH